MAAVPDQKKYVVYILSWDLFEVKGAKAKLANQANLPKKYVHVGIAVHNLLYHFTQAGIHHDRTMPTNYEVVATLPGESKYQITHKNLSQVMAWAEEQNNGAFGPESYDVHRNNCICFAEAFCDFLEVKFDVNFIRELKTWLETMDSEWLETMRNNKLLQYFATRNKPKLVHDSVGSTIRTLFVQNEMKEQVYKLSISGGVYHNDTASLA